MAKTYEVWDNTNPKTCEHYPYEVVEITEDGSHSIALFEFEADAHLLLDAVECRESGKQKTAP